MITIRELLNRIRWDEDFGRGEFAIGYFDRVARQIVVVPLGTVRFHVGEQVSLLLFAPDGVPLSIPLHRIYQVYRNGELIWHREHHVSHRE